MPSFELTVGEMIIAGSLGSLFTAIVQAALAAQALQ